MSFAELTADKASALSGLDITLFVLALAISVVIGVYFANKNSTLDEYMLGGRNQRLLPVATSMMTSFMSGLMMIGDPAEFYHHGVTYTFTIFAMIASTPFSAFILLPVFHRLGNLSVLNYLEQRYGHGIQRVLSVIFISEMILYNALVLYVPSLSLRSVLGISETVSIGAVGLSCIIYSTLGGIRAVIWTDFFQGGLMYISLLCVCIGGTIEVGGFDKLLSINQAGGRLETEPLFRLDATTRHTMFTIGTGTVLQHICMNGANQVQVQRAFSLPTLRLAQWAGLITTCLTALVNLFACYIGLILFATYQHCDPFNNHEIDKRDAIVFHYIKTHLTFMPGLRGIFVSGIFAATLSTLSSFQNSMSALVIEDFIKPNLKEPMSGKMAIYLGKILAMVFGCTCVAATFLVGRVSGLLQVAATLHGTLSGPYVATFILGMTTRFVNSLGITVGLLASFAIGVYVQIEQTFYLPPLQPTLPVYTDGCANNSTLAFQSIVHAVASYASNQTSVHKVLEQHHSSEFKLERISYLWIPLLGFSTCVTVAIVVSLLSGGWSQQVDDRFLVSWLHRGKAKDDTSTQYSFDSELREKERKCANGSF